MMAKKDKNYYEVTREKPVGSLGLLLAGASAGTIFLFLITILICAYDGIRLDDLIFYFLLAGFAGFFIGGAFTWAVLRYFTEITRPLGFEAAPVPPPPSEGVEPAVANDATPVVDDDETKGKSVDYVFPEFSPENQ